MKYNGIRTEPTEDSRSSPKGVIQALSGGGALGLICSIAGRTVGTGPWGAGGASLDRGPCRGEGRHGNWRRGT